VTKKNQFHFYSPHFSLSLSSDFSIPGGELGPTMKLRRHAVLKKYDEIVDAIYDEEEVGEKTNNS